MESEVPLMVYEFSKNKIIFSHILDNICSILGYNLIPFSISVYEHNFDQPIGTLEFMNTIVTLEIFFFFFPFAKPMYIVVLRFYCLEVSPQVSMLVINFDYIVGGVF